VNNRERQRTRSRVVAGRVAWMTTGDNGAKLVQRGSGEVAVRPQLTATLAQITWKHKRIYLYVMQR
jgi:hypothetical protein